MPEADYHELRATQEQAAAERSLSPAIRKLHADLARKHMERALAMRESEQYASGRDGAR